MSGEEFEKHMKEIRCYEDELRSMPREEFGRLYEIEVGKNHKERQVASEMCEKFEFFNQPTANANFEHWSKRDAWMLEEAIALAFGKDHSVVNFESMKYFPNSPFANSFVNKYRELHTLAYRAQLYYFFMNLYLLATL